MGFNTQPYLNNLFVDIRNKNGWVEPVCQARPLEKDKPREPKQTPAVVMKIGGQK